MRKNNKITFSVIDLYCGVGGFSLGAARAGFKIIGAIDNDPIMIETHKNNFPTTNHINENLSLLSGKALLAKLSVKSLPVTGVIGGPPCQGFTTIGKNINGDARNDLFIDFYRIVSDTKPLFFVCENVPGILRSKFSYIRIRAESYLISKYDLLPPILLNASDYGAPTSRLRVFFLGFLKSARISISEADFEPTQKDYIIKVKDALKGLPRKIDNHSKLENGNWTKLRSRINGKFGVHLYGKIPNVVGDSLSIKKLNDKNLVSGCIPTIHSKKVLNRWKYLNQGETDKISRARRLVSTGFCPTIRAGTGMDRGSFQSLRPIHPYENRMITPREAARLQGFPDWFQFHPTKWHSFRQIGNSVSPIIAEYLLNIIYSKLQSD